MPGISGCRTRTEQTLKAAETAFSDNARAAIVSAVADAEPTGVWSHQQATNTSPTACTAANGQPKQDRQQHSVGAGQRAVGKLLVSAHEPRAGRLCRPNQPAREPHPHQPRTNSTALTSANALHQRNPNSGMEILLDDSSCSELARFGHRPLHSSCDQPLARATVARCCESDCRRPRTAAHPNGFIGRWTTSSRS